MNNVVSQRFVECFDQLKLTGGVRSARQFAMSMDYLPQSFSEVIKGRRDITIEVIRKAVDRYHFNSDFLFTGNLPKINSLDSDNNLKIVTVVTDRDNNEKIVHVPIPAQAGYAGQALEPQFLQKLQSYSLPGFDHGTHRSFDVSGDSMDPSLIDGDILICDYVDPHDWSENLKNNHVYVIITRSDFFVKRVQYDGESTENQVLLKSDNNFYDPLALPLTEIKEFWYVNSVLRGFLHSQVKLSSYREILDLKKTISRQSHLINNFQISLERVIK